MGIGKVRPALVAVEAAKPDHGADKAPDCAPAWAWKFPGDVYKSHPAGEYIGYTYYHLPVPKNEVAKLAIFAARMALSNRLTR